MSRREVERLVMASLFAKDAKYRDRSEAWADATIALKQSALSGAPADAVLDELGNLIEKVRQGAANSPLIDTTGV
jgi:hypothetical protein